MKVAIDKPASVTVNVPLGREVDVREESDGTRGNVCVVRALEEKRVYDMIELVTGRMAKISRGDVIAGVLGERRALQGFVGVLPDRVKRGDVLNILNLGGVIGRAVSYSREYGQPLKVEVLGTVAGDKGPLNIRDFSLGTATDLKAHIPVIAVSGTSMNSGKTVAAANIARELAWKGHSVCSAKISGISALKDVLNMEDHGALKALSFLDFGYPSTVKSDEVPFIAKGALNELAGYNPDVVIVELGDGLLGDYGVLNYFSDRELRDATVCSVVCALDPVGAWGAVQLMKELSMPVHLISGPVTDNSVGIDYIHDSLNMEGINAVSQKHELGEYILRVIQLR